MVKATSKDSAMLRSIAGYGRGPLYKKVNRCVLSATLNLETLYVLPRGCLKTVFCVLFLVIGHLTR